MKITSVDIIKQGVSPKNGKPWTLAGLTFEGSNYKRSGFIDNPQIGQDLDVEFYEEEYNGKMQNKFKVLTKKDVVASQDREALMRIEKYLLNINHKVNVIYKHLGIEEKQYAGNTGIEYPTPESEGIDISRSGMVDELDPDSIPF